MTKRKRAAALLLTLLALWGLSPYARAEISFAGKVIPEDTVSVAAPFGGNIERVYLRAGDVVREGDPVATISTTPVYATIEGTVSGVFGLEGDSAENVITRYGAVMYIEPTNRFVINASTEKAYNSSETKLIHIGEKVYLSCTQDGTHQGTAIVTEIKDADESGSTPYTLEVTGGDFYIGETVGIYRSEKYEAATRIGRGTVAQNKAVGISASGSLLKMHVRQGDFVERGELLFETVEGVLDGLFAVDNTLLSTVDGVVATVDAKVGSSTGKGANLITVYPDNAFEIEIEVSEYDLTEIHEGDRVTIEFEWDTDGLKKYAGEVVSISKVSKEENQSGEARYSAYIRFAPDDQVRLGMSVLVRVVDEEELSADLPSDDKIKEETDQ